MTRLFCVLSFLLPVTWLPISAQTTTTYFTVLVEGQTCEGSSDDGATEARGEAKSFGDRPYETPGYSGIFDIWTSRTEDGEISVIIHDYQQNKTPGYSGIFDIWTVLNPDDCQDLTTTLYDHSNQETNSYSGIFDIWSILLDEG